MTAQEENGSLKNIQTIYPRLRLKYGVKRKVDKLDQVPDDIPRISLDKIESWTGKIIEDDEEGSSASTGLVEFHNGDILFNKLRPYLAKAFEAEYHGAASPELLVLEPTKFNSRYLMYLVLSKDFIDRVDASTYGAKMPRASWEFISDLAVPCPDKATQQSISTFLDYKTLIIDKLINDKHRLLELIQERQKSLLTSAVTTGKENDTELVRPDIPWIDSIPADWEMIRVKHLIKGLEQGWSPQCNDVPSEPHEWGILKTGCVNGMQFRSEENKQLPEKLDPKPDLEVTQGDVLMSRANTRELVGSCAKVNISNSKLMLCDKLYRFDLETSVCIPDFFVYAMNSAPSREQIELNASGASKSMVNISQKFIRKMWVPLPPLSEQEAIVEYVDQELGNLSKLRASVQNGLNLLQEKRKTLITAAVNGKIDLTDWQPPDEKEALA